MTLPYESTPQMIVIQRSQMHLINSTMVPMTTAEVNNKTEEHLSSVDNVSYSELIGNNSVPSSAHEEVVALDEYTR